MKPLKLKFLFLLPALLLPLNLLLIRCGGKSGKGLDNFTAGIAAVVGGMLRSTQRSGTLAINQKTPGYFEIFRRYLDPIPMAHAATCPTISTATCVGKALILDLRGCGYESNASSVYYNTYDSLLFEDAATCTAIKNGSSTFETLTNHRITRHFGHVTSPTDQNGVQLNFIGTKVTIESDSTLLATEKYSIFTSGWSEEKSGGMKIHLTSSGGTVTRTIEIPGIQLRVYWDKNENWTSLDDSAFWTFFSEHGNNSASDYQLVAIRDHTIYTKNTDSPLVITQTSGGNPTLPSGKFYTQYNLSRSVGETEVIEPLVWKDSTCCLPTAGRLRTTFPIKDVGLPLHDIEEVGFQATECGAIEYTRNGTNAIPGQETIVFRECY